MADEHEARDIIEGADMFKVRLDDGTEAATGFGMDGMPPGKCADCGKDSADCAGGMVFNMEAETALCIECLRQAEEE